VYVIVLRSGITNNSEMDADVAAFEAEVRLNGLSDYFDGLCPRRRSDRPSDSTISDNERNRVVARRVGRKATAVIGNNDKVRARKIRKTAAAKNITLSEADVSCLIRSWEKKQMEAWWLTCECCHTRHLKPAGTRAVNGFYTAADGTTANGVLCDVCRLTDKGPTKRLSDYNGGVQPAQHVPKVLMDLRPVEEALVSRIRPIVMLNFKKYGTLSASGHTISFMKDLTDLATTLPRLPEEVGIVFVKRSNLRGGVPDKYDCVRREYVQRALEYLITQPHYQGVQLNYSRLDLLPVNGPLSEIETIEPIGDPDEWIEPDDQGPAPEQLAHHVDPQEEQALYQYAECSGLPDTLIVNLTTQSGRQPFSCDLRNLTEPTSFTYTTCDAKSNISSPYILVAAIFFKPGHYVAVGRGADGKLRMHDSNPLQRRDFAEPQTLHGVPVGFKLTGMWFVKASTSNRPSESAAVRGLVWDQNNCYVSSLLTCLAYLCMWTGGSVSHADADSSFWHQPRIPDTGFWSIGEETE
jgi:hypothetical protein